MINQSPLFRPALYILHFATINGERDELIHKLKAVILWIIELSKQTCIPSIIALYETQLIVQASAGYIQFIQIWFRNLLS